MGALRPAGIPTARFGVPRSDWFAAGDCAPAVDLLSAEDACYGCIFENKCIKYNSIPREKQLEYRKNRCNDLRKKPEIHAIFVYK